MRNLITGSRACRRSALTSNFETGLATACGLQVGPLLENEFGSPMQHSDGQLRAWLGQPT
jgi:hypothetical protein